MNAAELILPGGRRLALAAGVADLVLCGALEVDGVTVGDASAPIAEMEVLAADARRRYAGLTPAEIPGLAEARRLYKAAGVDPTRTRPSSEALLRRALKSQPLPRVNGAVDAVNLASLSFLLPVGLYDLERMRGDAVLRLGREGEGYPGIRKADVHLAGRLGLFDEEGAFGSPTSDSPRTSVDFATRRLLAVVFATAAYPPDEMIAAVRLMAGLITRHCGGAVACEALLPARK